MVIAKRWWGNPAVWDITQCSYLPLQVKVFLSIGGNVSLSVKVFQLFGLITLLILAMTWCLGVAGSPVLLGEIKSGHQWDLQ